MLFLLESVCLLAESAPERSGQLADGLIGGGIPLLGGLYGLLMAMGVVPRNPKSPEKMMKWRKKFGPMMMVVCPILIIVGVVRMLMPFVG